ncbi:cytochrome c oxidase subunit II [Haloferax sp. DFSO60]|uniref:cytochrome c oxidase subunit II n=1 Tax=Haloferax sp. DFSO60 TaxID=3388652 RepID=UPI00397D27E2
MDLERLCGSLLPLQSGIVPRGTRAFVFDSIFQVFLALGTLVGLVVIGYMLYNAYKYRWGSGNGDKPDDNPLVLGELPTGSGGGRKLATSFFLSMIIVVSLISWTYLTLLYVEDGPPGDDALEIEVEGYQFGWRFTYPNGHTTDTLRVPEDRSVRLTLTSADVFHNFGVPELRVKSDAMPGQETTTWFIADETGTYTANCYELCGAGHSYMTADVVVLSAEEYESWYEQTEQTESGSANQTENASA